MATAVLRATQCAVELHEKLDSYTPMDNLVLKLRFSIACGDTYGIHVGHSDRWEFLFMGDSLNQIRKIEGAGNLNFIL